MTRHDKNEVGLRFTALADRVDTVRELYAKAGFVAMALEKHQDGCVTFIFPPMEDEIMFKLVNAIPFRFSALQGNIVNKAGR